LAAAVSSGCSGGSKGTSAGVHRAPVKAPVAMIPTPRWAMAACASIPELRRFCPSIVPLTRNREWTLSFTVMIPYNHAV